MKKLKVSLKINDYLIETDAIENNNIISFKDNDELQTDIIFDLNNLIIIRDNKEITIKILLNDKIVEYFLKKEKYSFKNDLELNKLNIKDNKVIINYQLDESIFNLEFIYEEVIK